MSCPLPEASCNMTTRCASVADGSLLGSRQLRLERLDPLCGSSLSKAAAWLHGLDPQRGSRGRCPALPVHEREPGLLPRRYHGSRALWGKSPPRRAGHDAARPRGRPAPDLVDQDFTATGPNQLWAQLAERFQRRSRWKASEGPRHHVHPHSGGLSLPRRRGGRLEPQGRRLVHGHPPAHRAGAGRPGSGRGPASLAGKAPPARVPALGGRARRCW